MMLYELGFITMEKPPFGTMFFWFFCPNILDLLKVWLSWQKKVVIVDATVDGRNPAPVHRSFIPLFTGSSASQVVSSISEPPTVSCIKFPHHWQVQYLPNHRVHGGKTLGMGGPLIINPYTPYITWVFIGSESPFYRAPWIISGSGHRW